MEPGRNSRGADPSRFCRPRAESPERAGATLCWFGITWSLELYQQTVARLYRQGQASQTVVVQHIITDGTIDERILKALQYKDRTQSALIDAVRANLRK